MSDVQKYDPNGVARANLADDLLSSYQGIIREKGIDEVSLANARKRQLFAKELRTVKLKGAFKPEDVKNKKFKVVAQSGDETVFSYSMVDFATRLKAVESLEVILGLTKSQNVQHTGTIIVQTSIPQPKPLPAEFARPRLDYDTGSDQT